MIIEHKTLEIFGQKVFEKAVVIPPFKNYNPLQNEACFLFVLEGQNNSYSEQERLLIKQNEGVLMKCGNYIYDGIANKKSGRLGLLAIHFHPKVLKKIYKTELPSFLKENNKRAYTSNMVLVKTNHLISRFIDDILYYLDSPELYDENLAILKIKEIIMLLLKTENAYQVKSIIHNFFSHKTFTLKEIVESHILSPIKVTDLAQLTNNSLASFKRKFREIYNDSPANYIKNRRLEKAAELLLISNDSISAIAYDCQFNNIAHFSNSFKTRYKISPTKYRLSQLQK